MLDNATLPGAPPAYPEMPSEHFAHLLTPEQVGDIQRKLASLDFPTQASATAIEELRVALASFQKKYRLTPADGVLDPTTWRKLDEQAGTLFGEVLQYELDLLRPQPDGPADSPASAARVQTQPAGSGRVRARAHQAQLAGLALSGGGIRSATFNLGVLQALAEHQLLRDFDYLSTVSGGGYIGAWLSKWIKENHGEVEQVERHLQACAQREPVEVQFLRRYSNYLTPKTGLFSADTWTLICIYIRNSALNLTLLTAWLAALLVLPRLLIPLLTLAIRQPFTWLLGAGGFLLAVSLIAYSIASVPDPGRRWQIQQSQAFIITYINLPLLLAAFFGGVALWSNADLLLTRWHRLLAESSHLLQPGTIFDWQSLFLMLTPGLAYFVAWAAGWTLAQLSNPPGHRFASGASLREVAGHLFCAIGALGFGSALLLTGLTMVRDMGDAESSGINLIPVATFAMPLVLLCLGATMTLMIGLVGRMYSDASREWWSRQSAWAAIFMLGGAGLCLVTFYAPPLVAWLHYHLGQYAHLATVSWLGTTYLGLKAASAGGTGKPGNFKPLKLLARLAPPIFSVGLLILLAVLLQRIIAPVVADCGASHYGSWDCFFTRYFEASASTGWRQPLIAIAACAGVGLLLGWRVDINKFSLYMMYRVRLVRAYFGASNAHRQPHPLTGFDPSDDPLLKDMLSPTGGVVQRPYHIINTTLNLVGGEELAWQTRKAAAFAFTPAFCGFELPLMPAPGNHQSRQEALRGCFRPSAAYASAQTALQHDDDLKVKLGMAVAVSGAAASPNMGSHSSAPLSFLMTMFNVRLGRWCPNPRKPNWRRSAPAIGFFSLLSELFGLTNANARYVYLSDGGHFENLGIYELVRRRCRLIVAIDASADGALTFEDLGNAIRKCATDLHVDIHIQVNRMEMSKLTNYSTASCVTGRIRYSQVDGPDAEDGLLLYIKPTIMGEENADVLNYRKAHPDYPHQSTADQWFDECQFESYRALGHHIASQALGGDAVAQAQQMTPLAPGERHDIAQLCAELRQRFPYATKVD